MLAIISTRKEKYVLMVIICWILKSPELFTISASSNSHMHGNHLGNLIQLRWKKDAAALKQSSKIQMFVVHRCHLTNYVMGLLLCLLSWTLNPEFWHARPVFYCRATPSLAITVYLALAVFLIKTVYVNFTQYFDSINVLNILNMHFESEKEFIC